MAEVFMVADNIYSPVAPTAAGNFEQVIKNISGIQLHENTALSPHPFYASLFPTQQQLPEDPVVFTKFEQLLIASITDALNHTQIKTTGSETVLIISSTKGNISLLETEPHHPLLNNRISLHCSAKKIAGHFGFAHPPVVTSNACISGLLGILIGKRLIESGQYKNAVVAGADVISRFVLSGFQSFQAISPEPCQPFDANRKGITLGEGAATVILSSQKEHKDNVRVMAGSVSNDANHISAPSRTGKELAHIITRSLHEAGLLPNNIGMVSAHGTATLYNDEMEAKAISLAGLGQVPVNSLKGYFGHTLGAAGLIESIISVRALQQNTLLPTRGFETLGVEANLSVSRTLQYTEMESCLKTASGFGGCNAAMIFSK